MNKTIWVLGSKHFNAHKSISWLSPFPNFSNCDTLIINLPSLGKHQLQKRYVDLMNQARRYIFDMLMTDYLEKKEVIVVLSSNQEGMDWLPIHPIIRKIAPAKIGYYRLDPLIYNYLKTVEECSFYIHDFNGSYVELMTNPRSGHAENYFFTQDARIGYLYRTKIERRILNKANQTIGCYVGFEIYFGEAHARSFSSGRMLLLPPPTKVTAQQAIDLMVNFFTGAELIESPPTWENKIDLPGLKNLESKILQREKEREKLIKEIEKLQDSKDTILKFRRLLWTKGTPLEEIVKDAFVFLGFPEIRKIRERNLEDWVIDFKFIRDYQYGVFEIKGADARTSLADLTQCNKWVEDYMLDNKKAKGIFVPNQHRLSLISSSLNQREHFEENEKEYAKKREICILPAHEIFFAVIEKMKNNPKITRKFIEEKIAASKGICKLSEIA